MMWRTHLAGGIALSVGALLLIEPSVGQDMLSLAAVCGAVGSLLPDLDAANAKIHHTVRVGGIEPLALSAAMIHGTLGHRGGFHSLTALAVVAGIATAGAVASGFPVDVTTVGVVALGLGFLSHLLLDACTPHGVPFFLPFQRIRFHVLPRVIRVVTGSVEEDVVLALLATLCLVFLVPRLAV